MADVEIKYNNSTIASLNDSGTEVLETNGTFLTDDITVEYTKSGGGGGTEMVDVECSRATDYYLPDSATQNGNIITLPKDSCFAVHIHGMVDVSDIPTTGTVEVIVLCSMFRDFYFFVKPGASGGSVTFS